MGQLRCRRRAGAGRRFRVQRLDGNTYIDLDLDPEPSIGADVALDDIAVWKPTARSGVSSVASARTIVELDSLQSALRVGDHVIIQRGATVQPFKVTDIGLDALALSLPPDVQALSPRAVQPFLNVTKLTITPALPSGWQSPVSSLSVHFGMVRAGSLTSPAQTRLNVDDLFPSAPFEVPVEPPTLQPSGSVLLAGADGSGANLTASVSISADDGTGSLTPQQSAEPFATDLRTPVTAFGNLIHATRGESVPNEVLGSGDAKVAFQAFKLKKKPLTYLNDESAPNGRRSTLAVRVNAILWTRSRELFRSRATGRSLYRAAK